MSLDLFRSHHVRHLQGNVPSNLTQYSAPRAWANKATADGSVRLSCGIEPKQPLKLELPIGSDLKDLENTKIVHQALIDLSPLQARDPRLWVKLAHVDCWSYMRKRWDMTAQVGDDAKRHRYILDRYFITQHQSRKLLRHGIARLWWYGHLTYDTSRKGDPYQLTAVLLSLLDIAQQLLERNMGRAPAVRTGFLEFLRKYQAQLGSTAGQRRHRIRDLAKALNLRGGVTLLDCMTTSEVESLLLSEANTTQNR